MTTNVTREGKKLGTFPKGRTASQGCDSRSFRIILETGLSLVDIGRHNF